MKAFTKGRGKAGGKGAGQQQGKFTPKARAGPGFWQKLRAAKKAGKA